MKIMEYAKKTLKYVMKALKWYLILTVVIIVVVAIAMSFDSSPEEKAAKEVAAKERAALLEQEKADARKKKDNHRMAYVMMQEYVKKNLKAPSTAKFPSLDYKWQKREDIYDIVGYVDSQNSFGAMIRTKFSGTIQDIGDDYWKLINLAFE